MAEERDQTTVRLSDMVTAWLTYVIAAVIVIPVFIILKFIQRYWENPGASWGRLVSMALIGRIPNISFVFVVVGFLTILLLARAFSHFRDQFKDKSGALKVEFTRGWLFAVLGLTLLEWIVYLQAVYRDGGTFFFAVFDDYDHIPAVCMLQTIEGILNLIGLAALSGWAIMGHRIVSELPAPRDDERESDAARCACVLVRAGLYSSLIFLLLMLYSGGATWHRGIKSAVWAMCTTIVMWLVVGLLFVRGYLKCRTVVMLTISPPFVRLRPK